MRDDNTFALFSYDYGDETICLTLILLLSLQIYFFLNLYYKKYSYLIMKNMIMLLLKLETKIR